MRPGAPSPGERLATDLDDLEAAVLDGLARVRRARDARAGRDRGMHRFLVTLAGELEEDRRVLLDARDRLGIARGPVDRATGALGARVVRLAGVRRTHPTDEDELGRLHAAIRAKGLGWLALDAHDHPALRGVDLAAMARRARGQADRVARRHRPAERAFDAA